MLKTFPTNKLVVVWSEFRETNLFTNQSVNIPTSLPCSFMQRYKLNQILRQPFNTYIYVTHQNFASVLNPPGDVVQNVTKTSAVNSNSLYPCL